LKKEKETLFSLRDELFSYLKKMQQEESLENFSKMPFMNSKGYHNKSIAYAPLLDNAYQSHFKNS